MNRTIFSIAICISATLLTSCIRQDFTQKIDSTWKANISAKLEITVPIPNQMGSDTSSGVTSTKQDLCKDFKETWFKYLKDWKCVSDWNKAEISWSIDLNETKAFYSSWWIYVYNLKISDKLLSKKDEVVSWNEHESTDEEIENQKKMGFVINYTLEMPWEIIRSNVWVFSWAILNVDGFDISKVKNAIVVSKDKWLQIDEQQISNIVAKNFPKTPLKLKRLTSKQKDLIEKMLVKKTQWELKNLVWKISKLIEWTEINKASTSKKKQLEMLKDIMDIATNTY